jgi:hypothetical protein
MTFSDARLGESNATALPTRSDRLRLAEAGWYDEEESISIHISFK